MRVTSHWVFDYIHSFNNNDLSNLGDTYAAKSHTHTVSDITDMPSSSQKYLTYDSVQTGGQINLSGPGAAFCFSSGGNWWSGNYVYIDGTSLAPGQLSFNFSTTSSSYVTTLYSVSVIFFKTSFTGTLAAGSRMVIYKYK